MLLLSLFDSEGVKDHFRECGGLTFVKNLLTTVSHAETREILMYTTACAVERNGEENNHVSKLKSVNLSCF